MNDLRRISQQDWDPDTDVYSDVLIIGSGMGGGAYAAGLAETGLKILMLEAGDFIPDSADNRDPKTIYQEKRFHNKSTWLDRNNNEFIPGTYEWVGGNTKFYGGVLYRYRETDFKKAQLIEGVSPAWPFDYQELQPWYERAERLLKVRGRAGDDPTEPPGPYGYMYDPVPDEPSIKALRHRLETRACVRTSSLPLGVNIDEWMKHAQGPWDGYPDATNLGKMDSESCFLPMAAENVNFKLVTKAPVNRIILSQDGRRVEGAEFTRNGRKYTHRAKILALAAGTVNSAALLLKSGLANSSDQVGSNFMNHIFSVLLSVDPMFRNTSAYQKTLSINDFYFQNNDTGRALGNIQLLGRIFGDTLKHDVKFLPRPIFNWIANHSAHFFLQSEDVPKPENRVTLKDGQIKLEWYREDITTHLMLVKRAKKMLRQAGFPLLSHRLMDESIPYHQCGTVCMGNNRRQSVLNQWNVTWDHPNLLVVDASALVSSAAVNPDLTVAAMSLRAAENSKKLIATL